MNAPAPAPDPHSPTPTPKKTMPCWIALHTSITPESGGSAMTEAAAQRAVA